MALAFSIANITAARITNISATVAFGNRNSDRIVSLLDKNVVENIGESLLLSCAPAILQKCSRRAPYNKPQASCTPDENRTSALLLWALACTSDKTSIISSPYSRRYAAG